MRPTPDPTRPPPNAAPLWAVQSLVFIASLGTGVITNGIFFIAKQACGFSTLQNFALGVAGGLTYIVGAAGVGPALRRLAERNAGISTRAVVVTMSVLMAAAALVPQFAVRGERSGEAGAWAVWVAVLIYMPCSGAFWPIVESYLGGGRSGKRLRLAVGQFNIVWASAVIAAAWAMAPALRDHPLLVLTVFGLVQLASTLFLLPMGAEPGRHLPEQHEPHPAVYAPLLTTFRLLLPTSYYIMAVWMPYAPSVMERLGVALAWQVPLAAVWMVARLGAFAVMERWHGWQGRWWPVVLGVAGLVGGIAAALLSPLVGPTTGLPLLVAGLTLLGVGAGVVYSASLYYAMEVGRGEVQAGGTHEALIGLGFAGGPLTGLAAVGAVGGGERGNIAVLVVLAVVLSVVGVLVARRVWRAAREAGVLPESA